MAGRIAGITIEIGGDTTNLQKSLKNVDKQLKTTQNNLKDVDRLLKLKPTSVELLVQKQKNLKDAIKLTSDRLEELKKAQEGVQKGSAEWDALQREIIETETNLKGLEKKYKEFGSVASQEMKAVGKTLKDAGKNVEDFGKQLSGFSGAAATVAGGILALGYDAVQSADELATLSQQTGISTDELQKMQYASELVDVSVEDMTGALRKLKGKIDPSNKSLAALGISATNADGSLRDATDVFYDALKALSGIENETERDQIAMELFGKSADSLAGIIDDGGEGLRMYGQQAEDLGLILDGDTINSLNDTNDLISQMKGEISGTMAVIGAEVVPIIAPLLTQASELISRVAEKLREMNPETLQTIMTVAGIAAALAPVLIIGGKLLSGLGSIVSVIGTVVGFLGGPLTLAIGAVVAAGVLLYQNWDTIKENAIALKDNLLQTWEQAKTDFGAVVDSVKEKIDNLKQKFVDFKDKVKEIWEAVKTALTGNISLPHIKLPHFTIRPAGWKFSDLLQGSIPALGIEWYRRAYDNPVMFTSPTVMATPGGLKGFGDGHGAEIVMGLDKLREIAGTNTGSVVINVYPSQGMNEQELADKIQRVFVANARNRRLLNA